MTVNGTLPLYSRPRAASYEFRAMRSPYGLGAVWPAEYGVGLVASKEDAEAVLNRAKAEIMEMARQAREFFLPRARVLIERAKREGITQTAVEAISKELEGAAEQADGILDRVRFLVGEGVIDRRQADELLGARQGIVDAIISASTEIRNAQIRGDLSLLARALTATGNAVSGFLRLSGIAQGLKSVWTGVRSAVSAGISIVPLALAAGGVVLVSSMAKKKNPRRRGGADLLPLLLVGGGIAYFLLRGKTAPAPAAAVSREMAIVGKVRTDGALSAVRAALAAARIESDYRRVPDGYDVLVLRKNLAKATPIFEAARRAYELALPAPQTPRVEF